MNWLDLVPQMPQLAEGAHHEGSGELCMMEMVAFMERLPHSDEPECTCPVLAAYTRKLNDEMPGEVRNQLLLPIGPRLVGTVNPALEKARFVFIVEAALGLSDEGVKEALEDALHDAKDGYLTYSAVWASATIMSRHMPAAIQLLSDAIDLDPNLKPSVWTYERARELV